MSKFNPRKFLLKLILSGTTILAIPVAIVIGYLLYDFAFITRSSSYSVYALFALLFIIAGFVILGGYVSTAKSGCHNKFFWLASTVYNFALCGIHLKLYFENIGLNSEIPAQQFNFTIRECSNLFLDPFILLSLWTLFVAVSSIYYFKFAISKANFKLL